MPKALTNIKVNGRWYDAGDDLDDLSEEELADLAEVPGAVEFENDPELQNALDKETAKEIGGEKVVDSGKDVKKEVTPGQ